MPHYLAADLGAESGRVMLGNLEHGRLSLTELHRFPNRPLEQNGRMLWDAEGLFREIRHGIAEADGVPIHGIGVDTWGVDFAFLTEDGRLIGHPYHYRDERTRGAMDQVHRIIPREELFEATGTQFMRFNSLYQLVRSDLAGARRLLFMPDLFNYLLTGIAATEPTIASTSQFYNPATGDWSRHLLRRLGVPDEILPRIVHTGSLLGLVKDIDVDAQVFATAGHDTASAVAAVPAEGDGWCYISSGTWSLMGVETQKPILTKQCMDLNFTNEAGAGGRIRLLKNIAGLWILQECRKQWAAEQGDFSYGALVEMAAESEPFSAVIDVDRFLAPGFMPERIRNFCLETDQEPPNSPGEIARTIFESLAIRYRLVKEDIEVLTGQPITRVHIVGGGSKNELLNQFTADACQAVVIAGPCEATAAGNILVQSFGSDLNAIRGVVRRSFDLKVYKPRSWGGWDKALARARKFATPAV